jgi:putative phosphoribosyl transferase
MGRRLSTSAPPFHDRAHAGDLLARRLSEERGAHLGGDDLSHVVVVGLPRGGVAVAAPVAHALAVPLDVVVVRKLGVPWQPEVAAGAVGEGGVRVLNPDVVGLLSTADLEAETRTEQAEVAARVAAWRGRRTGHEVAGRTVVLVDDGIATGATARAAVHVLRALGAARIVLAVPVVAHDTADQLRGLVDDLVALLEPEELWAVGAWYDDFTQVDDAQVRTMLERAHREDRGATTEHEILVEDDPSVSLPALVTLPRGAWGLVLFAHGSGSSRLSPRNTAVAEQLHAAGLGTVLLDLLTGPESFDRENVFDVALLGRRLLLATRWTDDLPGAGALPVGYFGASTGAGAALWAAAEHPDRVQAVVSRGGRPDLAGSRLAEVTVPTLLVVGSLDTQVLALNRAAQRRLHGTSRLDVVPGATHLFEEPGTLHAAADLAVAWFAEHLTR